MTGLGVVSRSTGTKAKLTSFFLMTWVNLMHSDAVKV
jgi:hypothetical protein